MIFFLRNHFSKMDTTQDERWAAIQGYDGYEISTNGRVRSYWRCNGDSKEWSPGGWSIVDYPVKIRPAHLVNGYYSIRLSNPITKKRSSSRIHRLMAIAFIPNPNNLPCVDHIDGNTRNNCLSNLRWCSKQQNCLNQKERNNNTSGARGVEFKKDGRRLPWRAVWKVNGSNRSKCFATKEEAIAYRRQMVQQQYDMEFYNER